MSSGINTYARLLLGLTSRDNSGSFRCYRVSKLAEMDLDQVIVAGIHFRRRSFSGAASSVAGLVRLRSSLRIDGAASPRSTSRKPFLPYGSSSSSGWSERRGGSRSRIQPEPTGPSETTEIGSSLQNTTLTERPDDAAEAFAASTVAARASILPT